MTCTSCGRETPLSSSRPRCWQCAALADAMQELWNVLADASPSPATPFASSVGNLMRVTLARNVPN